MYDALIVLNGEIPRPKFWQDLQYRTLICTDGAATTLASFNVTPNIIIGDMDSIGGENLNSTGQALQKRFPQSEIHRVEEQNSTDFEKALNFAKRRQFQNVLCLGALGKAADHSLHNLLLLCQYHNPMNLMLLHQFGESRQWIFSLGEKTEIRSHSGEMISFFPFPEATLSTQGLQWELNNTLIAQMEQSGVRNTTLTDTISVYCQGKCLCFLTALEEPRLVYRT